MNKLISLFFYLFSLSFCAQNDTISVVKHTENDFVTPKDLKVVYRGILNSLSIEVPNCKSFTASGFGLTLVSKNLYNLNPGAGLEVEITIDIILKNNKLKSEKHIFKIKNTPSIAGFINGKQGEVYLDIDKIKGSIITAKCPDKNLDFKFQVLGFYLSVSGDKSVEVDGNKIDDNTFSKLKRIKKGTKIIISGIKFRSTGKTSQSGILFCKISQIIINII